MNHFFLAGAFAFTFAAQQAAPAQAVPAQPAQQIPDAPRPQSPAIGSVTPGIAATSSSSSPSSPAPDPDQPAVGTSLPASTQTSGQAGKLTTDSDPAPDAGSPSTNGGDITTLSLTANFVDVPFTVKDRKGALVPGLSWRDVRVYENGVRQKMAVFTVDPFPLSVALVIDQSLTHDTMAAVNNSLGALPSAFASYDEVSVFTYNNGPKQWTDFTAGQSPRLVAILDQSKSGGRDAMMYSSGPLRRGIDLNGGAQDNINPLTAGGPGSPQGNSQLNPPREVHTLNDAIFAAAQSLVKVGPQRRRVIYVISDGKEYGSKTTKKEVIRYLQQNKIAVYATLVGDPQLKGLGFVDRMHLPLMMRDNILPDYTATTGGQYYAEWRQGGIETSFGKIAEQVRTQYTVGYYSREPFIDGKYRKLEVRVLRPNLDVIAKDGYYPAAQETRPPAMRPASTSTQQ